VNGKDAPRVSALVVAHDEDAHLPACLAALAFCDEIVVVLDRCTDGSADIAHRLATKVVEGAWPTEGPRRQAGVDSCAGPWVLEIDADERVPPALAAEIRRTVAASDADWHRIPVDNHIGERLVRHGWGASFGVGSKPVLCRKGAKSWGGERVHPSLAFRPGARQGQPLAGRIVHYVDRDLSDTLRRFDRYTSLHAADLVERGDAGPAFRAYRRIVSRFWRCFVGKRGWREGGVGFLIAACAALYPVVSHIKARFALEEARGKQPGDTV